MTLGVRFAPPMLRITPYRLRFPPLAEHFGYRDADERKASAYEI
jgi:hypothetical protein